VRSFLAAERATRLRLRAQQRERAPARARPRRAARAERRQARRARVGAQLAHQGRRSLAWRPAPGGQRLAWHMRRRPLA